MGCASIVAGEAHGQTNRQRALWMFLFNAKAVLPLDMRAPTASWPCAAGTGKNQKAAAAAALVHQRAQDLVRPVVLRHVKGN